MSGLNVDRVQAALSDAVVGHRIYYHRVIGSTMDVARVLARADAREGVVIIAEEQTKGRGRFSRVWVSPPGLNLYMTIILRPSRAQLPQMNMAIAIAIHQTAADMTGLDPSIKWPNDIRIGERKLSGILIETEFVGTRLDYALAGVGINVNLEVGGHPEIADIATSLRSAAGREFDRADALLAFLRNLDDWYARVRAGESLTALWAERSETLGRQVRLRWKDQIVEGIAESVDDEGGLILLREDGSRITMVAGEVTSQV